MGCVTDRCPPFSLWQHEVHALKSQLFSSLIYILWESSHQSKQLLHFYSLWVTEVRHPQQKEQGKKKKSPIVNWQRQMLIGGDSQLASAKVQSVCACMCVRVTRKTNLNKTMNSRISSTWHENECIIWALINISLHIQARWQINVYIFNCFLLLEKYIV